MLPMILSICIFKLKQRLVRPVTNSVGIVQMWLLITNPVTVNI